MKPGTNFFGPVGATIQVSLSDELGNSILAKGTVANLPSGVAGYAVSSLYLATDSSAIYQNTGTEASCTFTLMDTASTSLQLPEAATDATTTTGTSLALTQNAVTTGIGFSQALNGLTTGEGHLISHTTSVIADGGSLLRVTSSGIDTGGATNGTLLDLKSTGQLDGTTVRLDTILTTGTAISIISTGVMATTGNLLTLTANSATTAAGLLRINGNGLTDGIGLVVASSATALTSTGRLLSIAHSGATTTSGIIGEVSSAATDETIVFRSLASGAITGVVQSANALATVTGIIHESRGTAATLTTGRYYSAHDAAGEVFGIGTNGHLISTVSATPPTIAVSTANGISAAAITAGGTDTCGVITTTGTQDGSGDTVLQVTFGKTYTTAPKAVMLFPLNSSASKVSTTTLVSPYISATAATTFDITIPEDSAAGATPSFAYIVIA